MNRSFAARMFLWLLVITTLEVWFTATIERILSGGSVIAVPWFSLQGRSSILQLGFAAVLAGGLPAFFRRYDRLPARPFGNVFVAAAVIMAAIFALELGSGIVLNRALKLQLWDYSAHRIGGHPFHYLGQISGWYIPNWFLAGLLLRPLNDTVARLAPVSALEARRLWRDFWARF